MAFTVEDGSGIVGANAYIDLVGANEYHGDRGHCIWEQFTDTQKEQAVVRATFYIEKRFRQRYRGTKMSSQQSLGWPRVNAIDNSRYLMQGIPDQLKWACAEYALRAANQGELAPDPSMPTQTQDWSDGTQDRTGDNSSGQIQQKAVSVGKGAVKESVTYTSLKDSHASNKASGSSSVSGYNLPEYPEADLYMEELLRPQGFKQIARGA